MPAIELLPPFSERISVPISKRHPELYHYTQWGGLKGIWDSQQLWAVRFDALNDPTEFRLVRQLLVRAITPKAKAFFQKRRITNGRLHRAILEEGGIDVASQTEIGKYIDALYEAMDKNRHGYQFIVPHITSFCTHANDHSYERDNGLLSQWRGYGGEESFALVFDAVRLEEMLSEESSKFQYIGTILTEVVYADDKFRMEVEFEKLVRGIGDNWQTMVEFNKHDLADYLVPLIEAGTLIKHRAFFEEREVRIVVFPVDPDYARASDARHITKPLKAFHPLPKPHVSLFGNDFGRLPIKRIVVGPSRDQKVTIDKVRRLVGDELAIVPSNTPYRPFQVTAAHL